MSVGMTALSVTILGAYDWLACGVVTPGLVPARTALFAGAAGHALSNTLGFHAVTGTAVRLRLYRRCGLGLPDALRIISMSALSIALGFLAMFAFGMVWGAKPAMGAALGLALAAFIAWLSIKPRQLAWRHVSLPLPPARVTLALLGLGAIETAAAIGALYVLLPPGSAPSFLWFAVAYISAIVVGIAAQVPGGLGVFEATLASLLAGPVSPALVAALLLYRLVYNILPFVIFSLALAAMELGHATRPPYLPVQLDDG